VTHYQIVILPLYAFVRGRRVAGCAFQVWLSVSVKKYKKRTEVVALSGGLVVSTTSHKN